MREFLKDVIKERKGKENYDLLFETIDKIIELSNIGRHEGLLSLEDIDKYDPPKMLRNAVRLVVDGTDPDVIKDICITRSYINMNGDDDPLVDYACIAGALLIQAAENPRIVLERMTALLPYDKEQMYLERHPEEKEEGIPIGFFTEEAARFFDTQDEVERALSRAEKAEVEKLIAEAGKDNIAVALKGLSGNARRILFDAMTDSEQNEVYDDYEYMGPVCTRQIEEVMERLSKMIREYC